MSATTVSEDVAACPLLLPWGGFRPTCRSQLVDSRTLPIHARAHLAMRKTQKRASAQDTVRCKVVRASRVIDGIDLYLRDKAVDIDGLSIFGPQCIQVSPFERQILFLSKLEARDDVFLRQESMYRTNLLLAHSLAAHAM